MIGTDFAGLLCTDEQVAYYCEADWPDLTLGSQRLAQGVQGGVGAGTWALTDNSVAFDAAGIVVGHTVIFTSQPGQPQQGQPLLAGIWRQNDTFAVSLTTAPSGHTLTLRRLGLPDGAGSPPARPSGATNVSYHVPYLRPQIAEVTRRLTERYRFVNPGQYRPEDFTEAAAKWVVYDLLNTKARNGGDKADSFAGKAKTVRADLERCLAVLDRTYGIEKPTRRPVVVQAKDPFTVRPTWQFPRCDDPSSR
jgi:hypothetical protein